MLGALDFLTSYPYGCTEQTLSSFLPNLVVARALAQLKLTPTERLSLRRSAGHGRRHAAARLPARRRRVGLVEDGREPPVHDGVRDLRAARDQGQRLPGERLEDPPGPGRAGEALSRVPARGAGAQGLHAVRARARRGGGTRARHRRRRRRSTARPRSTELWARRDDLTPYGRALLLLTLDAGKDARGDELAASLLARGQADRRPGLVGRRPRPAARGLGRHQRRSHGHGRAGAGRAQPGIAGARSRRALSAGQPSVRRVLGEHEADRDGALRPDGVHEGARRDAVGLCRRRLGQRRGGQDGDL